jgi:hypothetical protein
MELLGRPSAAALGIPTDPSAEAVDPRPLILSAAKRWPSDPETPGQVSPALGH